MRKVTAIFLMFIVSAQICTRIGIYVSWKINQDYLAKNVCENRYNPKSCCKAKCLLTKKLTKVDSNEQQNDQGKKSAFKLFDQEPFVINDFEQYILYPTNDEDLNQFKYLTVNYHFLLMKSAFQPPDVVPLA